LLSGLLASDEKDMMDVCLKEKLKLVKIVQRNAWISLLFIKGYKLGLI